MKAKVKVQFMPIEYEVQMYKMLQNLKQRDLDVNAYTEEFHKLSLRSKRQEEESEKVARYLNDLRMNIQDEINILAPEIVNKCFQLALRAKEKLKRSEQGNRDKGGRSLIGKGNFGGISRNQRFSGESSQGEQVGDSSSRGGYHGRRPSGRGGTNGSGRGSKFSSMRCYNYNQMGHPAYKYPEKASTS